MTATLERALTPEIGSMLPRVFTPPLPRHCTGPQPDPYGGGAPEECPCGCGLNPSTSWGFDCNRFAQYVLRWKLLPYQRWLNIHALEKGDSDGGFRFKILVVLISRQQGKTFWLRQLGLWRLFINSRGNAHRGSPGARLALIAAQNLQYAEGVLKDVVDEIRDHPGLSKELINHRVCLDIETPLLTASGWKTMETIQVGDQVYHPSGYLTEVLEVNPIYDDHECYELTTTDDRSVVCDAQHLWTVQDRRKFERDPVTKEFSWKWETVPTTELLRRGLRRRGSSANACAFRLPEQKCLVSKPVELPIDPYTLGFWLGDGNTRGSRISLQPRDVPDVLNAMSEGGTAPRKIDQEGNVWRIWVELAGGRTFITELKAMGLAGDAHAPPKIGKHVPDEYLTAGTDQRHALLAGLLDSDGSISHSSQGREGGRVVFTNTNIRLAEAVLYLARSLGHQAYLRTNEHHIVNGKDYGTIYRVFFTPRENPFRLTRKGRHVNPERSDRAVSIAEIKPISTRPVRCIKVDSEDGLFLAGKDLLVTHNTNGNHRAILTNRRYWRAATASRKGGRSLSVDIAMLDELREHHTTDAWDAIAPTTLVRPYSQIVCTSNAGDARSIVLRDLRDGAIRNITSNNTEDTTTGLFEWSVPDNADPRNEQYWHMANPALGQLNNFKLADLRAMFEAMQYRNLPGFQTEHLCSWVDALTPGIIPAEHWAYTTSKTTKRASGAKVYAGLDINYERSRSFIAIASRREDGLLHIEVVQGARGTDWIIPWLKERKKMWLTGIAVQKTGAPASGMIDDLRRAGIPVFEWGPGVEVAGATGAFFDGIKDHQIIHRPAPVLDRAAASGVSRNVGEGFVFDRRNSQVDVSPLIACVAATWLEHQPPTAPPMIHTWPDEDIIKDWDVKGGQQYMGMETPIRSPLEDIEGTASWWTR